MFGSLGLPELLVLPFLALWSMVPLVSLVLLILVHRRLIEMERLVRSASDHSILPSSSSNPSVSPGQ